MSKRNDIWTFWHLKEDKTIMFSQNVGNQSSSDAASHSRRTDSLNAQFVAIGHCTFVLVIRKL